MLVDALLENSVCVAEYLVQQGAKPDYLYGKLFCKYDVLGKCCWNEYYEACEFILENVSYAQELIDDDLLSGENLYAEIELMSPEIMELLIEYGGDIKKYGKDIRKKAKKVKNYRLVEYLDGIL